MGMYLFKITVIVNVYLNQMICQLVSGNCLRNSKLMVQKWRMEIWLFSHVSLYGVSNSWSSMLIRSVSIFEFICTIMHFSWYLLDKRPSFGIWPYLYHTFADVHPILPLTNLNLVQTVPFCFDPFIFPSFLDFLLLGFL